MSAASFQDLNCHRFGLQAQQQQQLHPNQARPSAIFNSSCFSAPNIRSNIQPPPLFRQQPVVASAPVASIQQLPPTASSTPQLTIHINGDVSGGLLSTANQNLAAVNRHHHHHHHHMMMTMAPSSSSPSSSSDGDGQSSNSSSSTSGIHSSIDSPSSSNSKLDDFSYGSKQQVVLKSNKQQHLQQLASSLKLAPAVAAAINVVAQQPTCDQGRRNSNSSIGSLAQQAPVAGGHLKPRPALKQKKSVSFSDKVEMVACAEEQCDDHLPNPLLARVLAGKLQ